MFQCWGRTQKWLYYEIWYKDLCGLTEMIVLNVSNYKNVCTVSNFSRRQCSPLEKKLIHAYILHIVGT
jgi:hypothetical protein